MNGLAFTKMQALGNDFIVIDATTSPVDPDPTTVRHIADRRFGVGCDQVLLLEPGRDGCDFGYRIFNADGGEVEHCGNGVRCVARRVRDLDLSAADRVTFAVGSRRIETRLLADGNVAVDMGAPAFNPAALPFQAEREQERYRLTADDTDVDIGAVSMGNPHAVIAVEDVAAAPVTTLGPRLETHAAFPQRVNVGFMAVHDRGHISLRVWERGAGETPACGTGACAAVAVGQRWGLLDPGVRVTLTGGDLVIDWAGGDNPLWMTGPATTVFHGYLPGEP